MINPPSIESLEARIAPAFTAVVELSALDVAAGFTINGANVGDGAGYSVSDAGDVNGDGFSDLILSANGADPNGEGSGAAYLIFGSASGFPANPDLTSLDGVVGLKIGGANAADNFGSSLSAAGDVNGDGFDDLIIAATGVASGNPAAGLANGPAPGGVSGAAYVLSGKASFQADFSLYENVSLLDSSAVSRLSDAPIYGYTYVEIVVGSAGDIDGDGFAEVLVAEPRKGVVHVVYGDAAGLGASVDLSSLDGTTGFSILAENPGDLLGASVSGLGDVNGDGIEDFAIGAPNAGPNGQNSGKVYVVFGRQGGFPAGVDLASLDGTNGFCIVGAAAFDVLGTSVSAEDINGDGHADLIASAPGASTPTVARGGATYVIYGSVAGFPAVLNVADLNGVNGLTIHGAKALDESGNSVSGAGDTNRDGFGDLLIGASRADPNGNRSGAGFLVFGGPALGSIVELSKLNGSNGVEFRGGTFNDFAGFSVSRAGDLNGDGFSELIFGAPGVDTNDLESGTAYVVYGTDAAALPTLSISDATVTEGNKGPRGASFTVTLSPASLLPVTVSFSTADGTATAKGGDYTPLLDQLVTFQPGQTTQTIRIDAIGDLIAELDENFFVNLHSATNATIADDQAVGTIVDDDGGGGGGDGTVFKKGGGIAIVPRPDGTVVTLKTSKGSWEAGVMLQNDLDGFLIINIDASFSQGITERGTNGGGSSFSGAKISISAKNAAGGSVPALISLFDASDIGLKSLKIKGDLGAINVGGDGAGKTAIKSLKVNSIGPISNATPALVSRIEGTLGVLKVSHDLTGVLDVTRGLSNAINKVVINGNLGGGAGGSNAGVLGVTGDIDRVVIKGNLDGSAGGSYSGLLVASGDIKSVVVKGSVIGGATYSGIFSGGTLGSLKIAGDLRSADANLPVTISAVGNSSPTSQKSAVALKKLSITGSVLNAEVLAGYRPDGLPFNSDAGIGIISVGRNWESSSVVAGIADVTGDGFGRNDGPIGGDTTPGLFSRIASIVIKGTVTGSSTSNSDHFGITAQEIGKVSAGAIRMSRIDGPVDLLLDPANDDFRAVSLG